MSTNSRLLRRRTWVRIRPLPSVAGEKPTSAKKRFTRWSWPAMMIRLGVMILIVLWLVLVVWAVPVL